MSESNTNPDITNWTSEANAPGDSLASHETRTQHLFNRLTELGIVKLNVGFDGFRSEGSITYITKETVDQRAAPALKEADFDGKSLYTVIAEFISEKLDANHKDWQEKLGSVGFYTLDVPRRVITENFTARGPGFWSKEFEIDKEADERLREALFNRLAELGISKVIVECEGSGDSGEVVSTEMVMDEGRVKPLLEETDFRGKPVQDAIEEVALTNLSSDYPGWELDFGSDSTYVLNVPRRKVSCRRFQWCPEVDLEDDEDDDDSEEAED